jgi:transcriptional regulator with XRE-family HTH domain
MFALVGETLRRLRKEKGKTLEQVGRDAALGRGQLSRIENARQEATLTTLGKILRAQGVSRREFFRRYELVETEALAVDRESGVGGKPDAPDDRAGWPEEVRNALGTLGQVKSLVLNTLSQTRPVAQGAFEIGDLIVLFQVVPKDDDPTPPQPPEPPEETPRTKGKPRGSGKSGGAGGQKKR